MPQDVGFNELELKILSFLADGKGHALWKMRDELKVDEGLLSRTLKKLKTKELIYKEKRPLARPNGERGPKIEYPWYIQEKNLNNIAKIVLSQINQYMAKGMAASHELNSLKAEGRLTPPLKHKLTRDILCYCGEADITMEFFKNPLYRSEAAKCCHVDCISYEGLNDLIHSRFGLLSTTIRSKSEEAEYEEIRKSWTPRYPLEQHLARYEQGITDEAERIKLEANKDAILKIKELWNEGNRNCIEIAEKIVQPANAVCDQIDKMLYCREIAFTTEELRSYCKIK
jgi:hypothetical protein